MVEQNIELPSHSLEVGHPRPGAWGGGPKLSGVQRELLIYLVPHPLPPPLPQKTDNFGWKSFCKFEEIELQSNKINNLLIEVISFKT